MEWVGQLRETEREEMPKAFFRSINQPISLSIPPFDKPSSYPSVSKAQLQKMKGAKDKYWSSVHPQGQNRRFVLQSFSLRAMRCLVSEISSKRIPSPRSSDKNNSENGANGAQEAASCTIRASIVKQKVLKRKKAYSSNIADEQKA